MVKVRILKGMASGMEAELVEYMVNGALLRFEWPTTDDDDLDGLEDFFYSPGEYEVIQ